MTRIIGIWLILWLMGINLSGQDQQFVVKVNGDTLYGKLMINPVRDNSHSMFFKGDDGSKGYIRPLRYNYVYYNDKYQFRAVPLLNQRLFMLIIREDERASLYNYIHKRDNNIITSRIVIRHDGEALELSVLNYKNQMKAFVDDCPPLVARLDTKEFRYRNHEELIAAYNICDSQSSNSKVASVQSGSTKAPSLKESVPASSTPPLSGSAAPKSDIQVLRLQKLDEFKNYLSSLNDFQFTNDVLELLSDLRNRIHQNSNIPNYLWSSLEAMVEDHQDLKVRAKQLQLDIR